MHFYLIGLNKQVHTSATFTYHNPEKLKIGAIVRVQFGREQINGVVLREVQKPNFKTKEILKIIQSDSLPKELLELSEWISDYYATHLGTVLQTILPAGLHKSRRIKNNTAKHATRKKIDIILTKDQKNALDTIINEKNGEAFLLHGVPGSGKTIIYIESAKQAIAQNKSVIILVPEISLTTQLIAEFSNHFPRVFVTHSQMSEAERHIVWNKIHQTSEPCIVIGPRSALFAPLKSLGLVVVDECHEQSFKQDKSPKYNAILTASKLTKLHRAKLILGSATPNVADLYLAKNKKMIKIDLKSSVFDRTNNVNIISRQDRSEFTKHSFLSDPLISAIDSSISNDKQVLIFHNRRGTSPAIICEKCGWQKVCDNCNLPMTFHKDKNILLCHNCNLKQKIIFACPDCKNPTIIFKGIGTKQIESEVKKLFPTANIARFDADNEKGAQLHERYQEIYDGKVNIIIGTQLIAKGLDIPNITTVGILQADAGMHIPDFSAREKTFQLLYQVSGRSGRTGEPGQTIIQTFAPDNDLVKQAANYNFEAFAKEELKFRKSKLFPPYVYMMKMTYQAKTEATAIKHTKQLKKIIEENYASIIVLGPSPSFYEFSHGMYNWQIILKSKRREYFKQIAKQYSNKSGWQIDMDPASTI